MDTFASKLFHRLPLLVAATIAIAAAIQVSQGTWVGLIAYVPMLCLLLVYRRSEDIAYRCGWRAAACRADTLLRQAGAPTTELRHLLAPLMDEPPAYCEAFSWNPPR